MMENEKQKTELKMTLWHHEFSCILSGYKTFYVATYSI